MNANSFPVEKPELDSEIMQPVPKSDNWLMSYADLVTVLLCFFILFFVIKARQQEKNFVLQKDANSKQELVFSDVTEQLTSSTLTAKAEIAKFDRHVEINAKNIFYKPESNELTLDGEYFFAELALKIFKFMPDLQIQISLGTSDKKYSPNTLARLMTTREYLTNLGIDPELVSVGTHKISANSTEDKIDEMRVFITKNHQKILR